MKRLLYPVIFAIVFVADRLTKLWALNTLFYQSWPVFNGFEFTFSWNRGISWGMFASNNDIGFFILSGVILVTISLFAAYTVYRALHKHCVIPEIMVLAGAVSNLVDRFCYGAVIDFIHVYCPLFDFPVFNVADSAIVLGVFFMMIKTMKESYEVGH